MKKIRIALGLLLSLSILLSSAPTHIHAVQSSDDSIALNIVSNEYGLSIDLLKTRPKSEIKELYDSVLSKKDNKYTGERMTNPSLEIVSKQYDLPISLLESMNDNEIGILVEGSKNTISKQSRVIEFNTDANGKTYSVERSELDYYNYLLEDIRRTDSNSTLSRDGSATTSESDCSWMRITINLNKSGRWFYSVSGTYNWLVRRNPSYNDKDMMVLSWQNGDYMPDTVYGYHQYYKHSAAAYKTDSLSGFTVPDGNKKSINCLKNMANSEGNSSEIFFVCATIRRNAKSGKELAHASYFKQTKSIDWNAAINLLAGGTALAASIYVKGSPTIGNALSAVSAIISIFNAFGGINNYYSKATIDTIDTFIDPQGELLDAYVTRLYDICLNRAPDITGLSNWVSALHEKRCGGGKAARGFFFSPEYIARNTNNRDYIYELYRVMLDRSCKPHEASAWLDALGQGYSREKVFRGFAESVEFLNLCNKYGINP